MVDSHDEQDLNAADGGVCAVPCPSPEFTRAEWATTDRLFVAMNTLSLLMALFLWITIVVFPSKRRQTNTLMFTTAVLGFAVVNTIVIMGTNGRPSNVSCKNATQRYEQADGGLCIFQAVTLFYFSLAGLFFWAATSLDLFVPIVLEYKLSIATRAIFNRVYIAIGWGVPALLVAIATGSKSFGGGDGIMPYCSFAGIIDKDIDWQTYYWPIMSTVGLGCIFMVSVMYNIARSTWRTRNSSTNAWWRSQLRPFTFLVVFIVLFLILFVWRFYIPARVDAYQESGIDWVRCLILELSADKCGDKPRLTPPLGLWYIMNLGVSAQGFLTSLIYGTQPDIYVLWARWLQGKGTGESMAAASERRDTTTVTAAAAPSATTLEASRTSASGSPSTTKKPSFAVRRQLKPSADEI
jgi:hypothetical protein